MAGSLGNYLIAVMNFAATRALLGALDSIVTAAIGYGLFSSLLGARWGQEVFCRIYCFGSEVDEKCALLGYYAACSDNSVLTFWDNITDQIFQGREFLIGYPETSVRNYHYMLHNSPK